jgi:Ankyrin repeat
MTMGPGTPVDQFRRALRRSDVDAAGALLTEHPDLRSAINAPLGAFGARPIAMVRKNLAMVDVLLAHGADLNLKSDWWAGPFGILEWDITPEEAAPLIARGATVDIFAACHLGMVTRVRELVGDDPGVVFARGGDGKTPLHCARTLEIARILLEAGADIDARDVDHESTAAQYLVRDAPEVTRALVNRGAWLDIFIAVGLRDPALVERCLREDPEALDHRTWQGKYTTVHHGRPSTREEIGDHRGDYYRWVFGHNVSAIDAARILGFDDMMQLLLRHATPAQRLLAACAAADRQLADTVVAAHPDLVATLRPDQARIIGDRAHANDTAAVALMVDLGFDPLVAGPDAFEPIRWAAFHGNVEMTRLLLRHRPPINVPDRTYGGTLLQNCLYGAQHGWSSHFGPSDYPATVRLLLAAGEKLRKDYLPIGVEDVDEVLREHLSGAPGGDTE